MRAQAGSAPTLTAEDQVTSKGLVAVLGATTAQNLFGDGDPLGQTVRVNNVNLKVAGVLQAKGSGGFGNSDDVVFVPLTTAQSRVARTRTACGGDNVSQINVQLVDQSKTTSDAAIANITALLQERHRKTEPDFTVRSQDDLLATASAQPIQTVVAPDAILLAFTVSAAIGLFFGVYPAIKASQLNPIQALRYE